MTDYAQVADHLMSEHDAGRRFVPFAGTFGITDLYAAYAVQDAFVERRQEASGARRSGYKVGLTSQRMQAMCGIDTPVAGVVLDRRVFESGVELHLSDYARLGLEFEICLVAGSDLPPIGRPYTEKEAAAAIESIAAAVELVDDRDCDYATLDVLSLVADNSWNAGVILGAAVPAGPDLVGCEAIVSRNGVELDRGHGRDALGGPLLPFTWLVNHLCARGAGLSKGDFVMTGSLVTTQFPKGPESYSFSVCGIGSVEVTVRA